VRLRQVDGDVTGQAQAAQALTRDEAEDPNVALLRKRKGHRMIEGRVLSHERADQVLDRRIQELDDGQATHELFRHVDDPRAHDVRRQKAHEGDQGKRNHEAEPGDPKAEPLVDDGEALIDDEERGGEGSERQATAHEVAEELFHWEAEATFVPVRLQSRHPLQLSAGAINPLHELYGNAPRWPIAE